MKKHRTHILLGVTGSIAAYKAAELVRLMKAADWDVSVVMTAAARRFVGELTFRTLSRNPVAVDMFGDPSEWMPEHLSLAERADMMVVAPCTANVIAKMAHGIADDLLTCAALAFSGPILVAPAMNERMWTHAATRANVKTLRSRGVQVVEAAEGDLACGVTGKGRMAEPEAILAVLRKVLRESAARK